MTALYLAVIVTAWARPEFSAEFAMRWLAHSLPAASPALIRRIVVGGRKVAHFAGYSLFTLVLCNALLSTAPAPESRRRARLRIVLAALGAVALAALDESRQSLSPFRSGAGADVLLDAAGIALAAALLFFGRSEPRKP